jgi:putative spermidine/putrescine transport system permease protein/spermidine/putrescine transport system permease protein
MRVHLQREPLTSAGGANADALARDERVERISILTLSLPSVLIIFLFLILPAGWLFGLSLFDENGFTLAHYQRMVDNLSYRKIFITTFNLSILTTSICILLGFPLAYFFTQIPPRMATLLLPFVLLPFWTSLLVRTYAWLVLLQRRGLINQTLVDLGIIEGPLELVHNLTGTIIGMTHIMLPFMVLPLYGSMKTIDSDYVRAAASLGSGPIARFWHVFFPLSLPGLMAGTILVFIICLGFYVTPQLLGGGLVTTIAMKIEQNINTYYNWGAASALGVVLLVAVLALFYAINRLLTLQRLYGGK